MCAEKSSGNDQGKLLLLKRLLLTLSVLLLTASLLLAGGAKAFADTPPGEGDVCAVYVDGDALDVGYASLAEALAAVNSGDGIYLLGNLEEKVNLEVAAGEELTIDLKGFDWALDGGSITVLGELSILGGGTVSGYDELLVDDGSLTAHANFKYGADFVVDVIIPSGYDELLVDGGSLTAQANLQNDADFVGDAITANGEASVTVTGNISSSGQGVAVKGNNASIDITGNITARADGICATGATIALFGSISAGRFGVYVDQGCTVNASANIIVVWSGAGPHIAGVYAGGGSKVLVQGDISLPQRALWAAGVASQGNSEVAVNGSITLDADLDTHCYGVAVWPGSQATINGGITAKNYIGFWDWGLPGLSLDPPAPPDSAFDLALTFDFKVVKPSDFDPQSLKEGYLQYSYDTPDIPGTSYVWVFAPLIAPPPSPDNSNNSTNPPPNKPSDIPQTGDTGFATAATLLLFAALGASAMILAKTRQRKECSKH